MNYFKEFYDFFEIFDLYKYIIVGDFFLYKIKMYINIISDLNGFMIFILM